MKRSFNPSAAQMAVLSGLGGLIIAIGFLLTALFYARFQDSGWLVRTLLLMPTMLVGATLWILAEKRLKRGIQTGRWPPAEIEALRINLESSLWRTACWVCLIFFCIGMFEGGRYRAFGLAMFFPGQIITSLQYALRRTDLSAPRLGLDWHARPPIQSNHWGQR